MPGGIYRCSIRGHIGIVLTTNTFEFTIDHCFIQLGGTTYAGSRGWNTPGHATIYSTDFSGYEIGILAYGPILIIGGRIETCGTGVSSDRPATSSKDPFQHQL